MHSRALYFLAGTLALFAVLSYVLAFTGLLHEPGGPPEAPLWRTIGIFLIVAALLCALLGSLQHLFEQAERRDAEQKARTRKDR